MATAGDRLAGSDRRIVHGRRHPVADSARVVLSWLAAPVLILGAGIILMMEWRNADLDRWGRAVCTSGVATYVVFLLAVIACGDVEGGIPVGAQAFWQTVWVAAMIAAGPMLIAGGALMLLRRTQVRAA